MSTDPSEDGIERCPSGRPLQYTGRQGWARRMFNGTATAAGVGAAVGLILGACKGRHLPTFATGITANFAIAGSFFCGMRELTREILASEPDAIANTVLGGFASGALLARLQGGAARPIACGLLFATLGTGIQLGEQDWKEYRLRRFVNNLPDEAFPDDFLQDREKLVAAATQKKRFEWPEWFPIRSLSEEEILRRQEAAERKMRGEH